MPYIKTEYENNTAPAINATNLNKAENGIETAVAHSEEPHAPAVTSVITETSAYTVTEDDYVILCSNTFTLTLPTAVGHDGVKTIKNIGTGTITIVCDGVETIDGGTTAELSIQYESISIISDGGNWYVI